MRYIADLEVHSKYSRAVSPEMIVPNMDKWARLKGIDLVGTGDFTHPFWLNELKQNLVEDEKHHGLFRYKGNLADTIGESPLFLLSAETSHIFSQAGKLRRIHIIILAPSFEVVEQINDELAKRGNLLSDGRPILGLPSQDLLALVLSISQECLIIPAHVWTPWFGLYGSNGGFNSINEAFGENSKFIYSIETGMSSDPAMNWRISENDERTVVSFGDAHSLAKLGREATVFQLDQLSYASIAAAIRNRQAAVGPKIFATIEFFPEEGKYHYTGHRVCKVSHSPAETKNYGTKCPVCGRNLTVGVMHRVEELARRDEAAVGREAFDFFFIEDSRVPLRAVRSLPLNRPLYLMLVPLQEILAESLEVGVNSARVQNEYFKLVSAFGSEFKVLLETPIETIQSLAGERTAEGIAKVRRGEISIEPGYDGVFGKVKIWPKEEVSGKNGKLIAQKGLFD